MRRCFSLVLACFLASAAHAASTPQQDALIDGYFAIWDNNRNVTPETIARLYAPEVVYYGHRMSQEQLLRDKLSFIRRWPSRRYSVAPGTATRTCDAAQSSCVLTAVLVWTKQAAGSQQTGRSRVRLTLVTVDGTLKIVRESAVTLG